MITITLNISEDYIREHSDYDKCLESLEGESADAAIYSITNVLGCSILKKHVDKGMTDFVVKPDKLSKNLREVYEHILPRICGIAACSESEWQE